MSDRWLWARPPDPALAALARDLLAGRLPAGHELVKSGSGRRVWRVPAACLVLKHYQASAAEAWRGLVRPGRARREFEIMAAFCQAGIPVVRPVGCVERSESGLLREAWFLGRLVPRALTLAEALRSADAARRLSLAEQAVDLVAQLHGHPFLHRDLHAGNLLLQPDGRLLILDLHSVWRVSRLSRARRMANLAELLFSMRGEIDLRDAAALVRRYGERRGEDVAHLVRDVGAALRSFESDWVRGRTARCLRTSSEFVVEGGGLRRRREYPSASLAVDVAAHGRALAASGPDVLGRSRKTSVTCVGPRVVKVFARRRALAALRQGLGRGRARSAWVAARRLEVLDLATPRALALHERRDGSAVLVTDASAGIRLRELLALPPPPAARRRLAAALGHLVGRLWRAGLRHHDLSLKNVLVGRPELRAPERDLRVRGEPDWPLLELVDLDNLTPVAPHDPRSLQRMLGQIGDLPAWVGRTDRRRFVRALGRVADRALPVGLAERAAEAVARRVARRQAVTGSALDRPGEQR